MKINLHTALLLQLLLLTWQIGEEGKYYFLSKTFWVRKNNKWFRTAEGAIRLEKRKL